MRSTSKQPIIAGLLMLLGAAFNIAWLAVIFSGIIDPKSVFRYIWIASPLPYLALAIGFGGNSVVASVLVLAFVLGVLSSVVGGIAAIRRRSWLMALVGSLGLLVSLPLAGVIAIILLARGKIGFAAK